MSLAVDNPIVNKPFDEPTRRWEYVEGQPQLVEARRSAGYYLRPRTRAVIGAVAEEEFVPLDVVNDLRNRVRQWRQAGYPGATRVTLKLLEHWNNPGRTRKPLFFCQREAAETIIWLIEAPHRDKQGIGLIPDEPTDADSKAKGYKALSRYAGKMATGSGKTVVMAMVIAWSVLNKAQYRQDRRFSDAVLIICPNLTIKERLQVLYPTNERNYYDEFDVVPASLRPLLGQGRYLVTNWHVFNPQDDTGKRSVVQRGPESDRAFCRRVLADLGAKENLLVINDEAHHAYRPASLDEEEKKELTPDEIAEREEATVWVNGLHRIDAVRGINFCADLSATPFYIKGSGYEEGSPFPWIVSDFGLVDAIECGIVKIPQVPVDDNTGEPDPRYFRLWKKINERLPPQDRETAKRRAKPEAVFRESEGALATLASEWKRTFEAWRKDGADVPPVMIVVCDNTKLSELVYERIASGGVFPELANNQREQTLRIDTELLRKLDAGLTGTKADAAQVHRGKVNTVGKAGQLGERVRCVVSVGMLTEGWDAQNVTQILGLRAFTSQLLCEQVVGRGLRRSNYDDFSEPEYVDVYGIPFEVIPVKKASVGRGKITKIANVVRALPERQHLEVTFPRLEGFVFDVRHRIRCDVDKLPEMVVDPSKEPTEVIVKAAAGYRIARPDRLGPGQEEIHDRDPFHQSKRLQATVFQIAAETTNRLNHDARHLLFPQVLNIVWEYVEKKVEFIEAPPEELALRKYLDRIVEWLSQAIVPDTEAGEAPLLPVLERFRPIGSTSEVLFRTVRPCFGTRKSHVSHVVADSPKWEHSVAYRLEQLDSVVAYVKNDHLDFVIPYEYQGHQHSYRPDFLIQLRNKDGSELKIILEVKGFETEQDRAKQIGAERWVAAVNHHGELGQWAFRICRDPYKLQNIFRSLES